MKRSVRQPGLHRRWLATPLNSGPYRKWLIDKGSLTRRLQVACASFAVNPAYCADSKPLPDEGRMLGLKPQQKALIREVYLHCNRAPVVFAHSVLPDKSLRGAWAGLGKLGSKPLGATLFSNPMVSRTPLQFKKLSRRHQLYHRAAKNCHIQSDELWARRSIFYLRGSVILVTEIFLPQVTCL